MELSVRQGHMERHFLSARPKGRRRRVRPGPNSTSLRTTPNISIPSRSTRRSTASRGPRSPRPGPTARRPGSSSRSSCTGSSLTPIYQACRALDAGLPSTNTAAASNRSPRPARLGALLAQFPPSFKQTPESQGYLDALLERFHDYPIAVELRHRSWSDDFSATLSLLNAHDAALTQIDEPKFKVSIRQNQLPNITRLLLHAAARPERGAVVEARQVRGPLQLPVFGRRAEAFLRDGRRRAPAGEEVLSVFQQPLRLESRRQCRHDQTSARRDLFTGVYPKEFVERYPETASIVSTEVAPQLSAPFSSEPHLARRGVEGHPPGVEQALSPLRQGSALHRLEQTAPHCPVCGYLYERDYGDVWWVWIVTDRIPIGIGIIFLFFGFRVSSCGWASSSFGSLALPLLLTIPRRYGLAIAITYLIRKRWPDPKDQLSALPVIAADCPVTPMRGHKSLMAHAGHRGYTGRQTFCPQVTR